ncbi:hypothetical protein [Specibacter cremeus]|uniref:hypothetical protein n=1 Tax=Specibacter cremeus TaxID=1629051 RepID=UPI0013DE139A|nr:hypothetical protein [Specibacter cremeus]
MSGSVAAPSSRTSSAVNAGPPTRHRSSQPQHPLASAKQADAASLTPYPPSTDVHRLEAAGRSPVASRSDWAAPAPRTVHRLTGHRYLARMSRATSAGSGGAAWAASPVQLPGSASGQAWKSNPITGRSSASASTRSVTSSGLAPARAASRSSRRVRAHEPAMGPVWRPSPPPGMGAGQAGE